MLRSHEMSMIWSLEEVGPDFAYKTIRYPSRFCLGRTIHPSTQLTNTTSPSFLNNTQLLAQLPFLVPKMAGSLRSLASAVGLLAALPFALAGFSSTSKSNIAVYWGQNSYGQGSGPYVQERLSYYCQSK